MHSLRIPGKVTLGKEDRWTIYTPGLNKPVVYSGGAGKNVSFELELITQWNATVYLFDPSGTGIRTMSQIGTRENLNFIPVALSKADGTIQLFLPVDPTEGSYTRSIHKSGHLAVTEFPCRSIPSLMKELGHSKIDILKLDIEGAEYDVLHDVLDHRLDIDQVCVEFHHFFDSIPASATHQMMKRLKREGYVLFHRSEVDYSFMHNRIFKEVHGSGPGMNS